MMKTLRRIAKVWYDEVRFILKDEGIMVFILFVPLFYPLLYSYIYTREVVREVPTVVIDRAHCQLSREFIRKVDATPDARIIARCQDMAEAMEYMKRREAFAVIQIPTTFNEDLWKGEQTTVGLYCDLSSMLYYKALLLACTNVSLDMNRDIKADRINPVTDRDEEIVRMPIEYDHVAYANPQGGFASFLIPPVLMLIIQQTLILGIGMQMGSTREQNMGCIIPLKRTYKNPFHIVIGKTLVYLPIYTIMAIYMFTVVNNLFDFPRLGDYLDFLVFAILYIMACIFFGMTLSALIYRREDCIILFVFMSVPLLFLSGMSWPASAMPWFWKAVSWLFPSTFGMNGYVRITTMGATLSEAENEMLALAVQAALYFTTSCLMYRMHIRRMIRFSS